MAQKDRYTFKFKTVFPRYDRNFQKRFQTEITDKFREHFRQITKKEISIIWVIISLLFLKLRISIEIKDVFITTIFIFKN